MCKFNLVDAISTSIDPLSGWMEQKFPQAAWEYPMVAPPALEQGGPLCGPAAEADSGLPDDLQDLFLDSEDVSVPALPCDDANTLLEDLISGSVRENPQLFGDLSPAAGSPPDSDGAGSPGLEPATLLASPGYNYTLSPGPPQQVSLEAWVPTLSPSPGDPNSPLGLSDGSAELLAAPDWCPSPESPPVSRRAPRPRPYDKPGRRQALTEEERRQRKKEQNKNAATRYRQKKKEEHDMVSGDQEVLEKRNKHLRERVGSLTKELAYLKELMREVLRHKRVV
ncbi:activating transcription factor of chaperone-like [Pollicipes pollicipes]|uniref:activating transcription factor of chaperone-like n=1 Tax=Pollicipes pollicipes TaxID=41117 RepID=UPI001884B0DE|nr:activating transcription factor of chaperone-like [Pollicipes pollicipes]